MYNALHSQLHLQKAIKTVFLLKQEGERDPPRGSAFCLVFLTGEDPLCGLLHPPCIRTAIYLFFFISLPLSVTSSDTNSTSVIK